MARLLQQAKAKGIVPHFADYLLHAFAGERATLPHRDEITRPVDHFQQAPVEALSARELEVLSLMAAGLSNREIGLRLSIAPGTVKKHADNIYGKLGVHNRMQAVASAQQRQLL